MIKLVDGPAADVTLVLHRAPKLLRVVKDKKGERDGLDQLSDEPRPDEEIHVYRLVEYRGMCHVDLSNPRRGIWAAMATYHYSDLQPLDEQARDTNLWRSWSLAAWSVLAPKGKASA